MKISPVNPTYNNCKINFKGEINLINLKNDLLETDYKKLENLSKRIANEEYNITLEKVAFGDYTTTIKHDNGKIVKIKPLAFQLYKQTVPDFLESLMNIIDLKSNKS